MNIRQKQDTMAHFDEILQANMTIWLVLDGFNSHLRDNLLKQK
jgi:hypothetical protein